MSGHSKWNNIKRKKGLEDSKKGKVFSQLAKLIRIAVKEGKSGDPKSNIALRTILEKARVANMPKVNIDRAIQRGLGKGKSGGEVREYLYEGFGPAGVACLIMVQTDNTQRTASEIRLLLDRAGGTLAGPGAVAYLFTRQGEEYILNLPMTVQDEKVIETLDGLEEALRAHEDVEDVFWGAEWGSESIENQGA